MVFLTFSENLLKDLNFQGDRVECSVFVIKTLLCVRQTSRAFKTIKNVNAYGTQI